MCYDDNARPPQPEGQAGAIESEDLTLTSTDGTSFVAYCARPVAEARARVVIFPDVRGLHQFYKSLADRFAEQGVQALALDYFGRTAGLSPRDDSFEWTQHVQQFNFESFQRDVRAALSELDRWKTGALPTFTVGFCMGGALSFLIGTGDYPLTGVIGFYAALSRAFGGTNTVLSKATEVRYPLLGLFGGADQGIPVSDVEAFDTELDSTGIEHQVVIYPDAPHSFFDRKAIEFADASTNAWTRVLEFIDAHGAKTPAGSTSL